MPFEKYIDALQHLLERLRKQQADVIAKAGRAVADAVASGGIVHAFGTGHSHMMAEEIFYRAGGLAVVNPILDKRFSFLQGALESTRAERELGLAQALIAQEQVGVEDVAIIISNSGRNAVPIEMAMEMQLRNATVIAITSFEQSSQLPSRHPSGKRLFELADVVIDTGVGEGDAVLRLQGLPHPLGPCSTVVGAAAVNAIMIEAAAALLRKGQTVPVFPSANLETTTEESLMAVIGRYQPRIRYLRDVSG